MSSKHPRNRFHRRDLFHGAALGLAASGLAVGPGESAFALEVGAVDLRVEFAEIVPVRVPFREVPARNMARELPHWDTFEVVRVGLVSGHVGHGESMSWYTWGRTSEADLAKARGRNAASMMWDDSLGAGLQIALFDAVGRALGVPIHRLLGAKVRDRAALSWWAIDMPPEDWASECRDAVRLGYGAFKTKGRPWYDVREQVRAVAAVVPPSFKIDIDFNDTLLDADRAIPILKDLEATPQVGIFETPIPQKDVPGNKAIRRAVKTPIAMHYGSPPPLVALKEEVCDGFVVGGGARSVMQQGAVAAMADLPFWLQLVGTGITAAFSLHLAAVLSHAKWPAVNCHQLFTDTLLTAPIVVEGGTVAVPDGPGLGFEVNPQALRRFLTDPPRARPETPRLVEVSFPDGGRLYVASDGAVNFMLRQGNLGTIPYYRDGASARLVPDDGGDRWKRLHERASEKPFLVVP